MDEHQIVLNIIFRQSLNLSNAQIACCAADAVELILIKYFTMLTLAVKTKSEILGKNTNLNMTTNWLAAHSPKKIIYVPDDIWNRLKSDFVVGQDLFCLKTGANLNQETTLVMWPNEYARLSKYI